MSSDIAGRQTSRSQPQVQAMCTGRRIWRIRKGIRDIRIRDHSRDPGFPPVVYPGRCPEDEFLPDLLQRLLEGAGLTKTIVLIKNTASKINRSSNMPASKTAVGDLGAGRFRTAKGLKNNLNTIT
ncbi:hypothetical protein [Hartmannibacter diazotrophicus]|uniref:hypothetical protein n=1 Tax=Hartmannibacter diazotrophicus TaxID=1482074 RepID=UPI0012FE4B61|nr:hypothetical protein [Hartmannibacter diazotrophicus]